jgi:hypothetical protein
MRRPETSSGRGSRAPQRHPREQLHPGTLFRALVLFALLGILAGGAARAEGFDRGTKDKFSLSAGTYLIDFNTHARLDSETLGRGTDIDFEDALGLTRSQSRFRIDGYWRITDHQRLDFGGYFYNREANRTIDRQIVWGDVTYDVGAAMHSKISSKLFKFDWRYSFVRTDRLEFAASAGLSTISTRAELDGQGTVSGGGSASFQESSKGLTAPIPVFGLHGEWRMVRSLYLRGWAEYFAVSVGSWKGSVVDSRFSLDWYPFKHFGFGAGYSVFHIDASHEGNLALDFRYGFSGLLGYATWVY